MNKMKNEDFQKTNAILTLVLTLFSLVALILSWSSFHNSSNITKKINSVEFQISKEVRYQMIELVCVLRSIDTKAATAPHILEKMDYSEERVLLSKIQRSPSYHTYLLSIKDKDDRLLFDMRIRLLSESLLKSDSTSSYQIREWVHLILDDFEKGTALEEVMRMDYDNMLVNLCIMEGVYSAFTPMPDKPNIIADFTEYLIVEKRVNDPDVLFLNGAYNNDAEIMQKALDAGANLRVTDEVLIEKYNTEYNEFLKNYKDGQ